MVYALTFIFKYLPLYKIERDCKRGRHSFHIFLGASRVEVGQPALIQSADLFAKHGATLAPAACESGMSGKRSFDLCSQRAYDNRGGMCIAYIVLHDNHRAHTALFATPYGGEVSIPYLTSLDGVISRHSQSPF